MDIKYGMIMTNFLLVMMVTILISKKGYINQNM